MSIFISKHYVYNDRVYLTNENKSVGVKQIKCDISFVWVTQMLLQLVYEIHSKRAG